MALATFNKFRINNIAALQEEEEEKEEKEEREEEDKEEDEKEGGGLITKTTFCQIQKQKHGPTDQETDGPTE